MSNKRHSSFRTTWKQIQEFFEDWKWRLFTIFYLACSVLFYIWLARGTDFPEGEKVLLWATPLLVGFILKMVVDSHLAITDFVEPEDGINSKECVHKLFERLRKTARWKHTAGKPITIDVLGVSLHHSHEWIENDLKAFMKEFPSVHVELRIAFVSPSVLEKFNFDTDPLDWAAESHERVEWVNEKLFAFVQRSDGKLRVHVRTIPSLPQLHGILIERRYLFLGRVSWLDGTDRFHRRPTRLTCAQNGYRFYSIDDRHHGDARVSMFRRWMAHYLYGNHEGQPLLDTISPFYEEGAYIGPSNKGSSQNLQKTVC
jgi:hypothetical protein